MADSETQVTSLPSRLRELIETMAHFKRLYASEKKLLREAANALDASAPSIELERIGTTETREDERGVMVGAGYRRVKAENLIVKVDDLTARLYPDATYETYLDELTRSLVDCVEDVDDDHVTTAIRQATEAITALRQSRDETRRDLNTVAIRIADLKSEPELRIQHARMQGSADGFQIGWHAALTRIKTGDSPDELVTLVPSAAADASAWQPLEKKPDEGGS